MRRRNYLPLWILLVVAFVLIAGVSVYSPIEIFGYELKDSGLASVFSREYEDRDEGDDVLPLAAATLPDSLVDVSGKGLKAVPVDTASKTILFVGDSMLDGLYPRLAAYARHNGHKLYAVIWYSSTSEIWGKSGRLKKYISRLDPDYVFICLGANELFVKDISSKRARYVKALIGEIGDIPYLWIGPPNWKADTGINSLIASNTAPGTFFLSDGMKFERGKDGAHPTKASAAEWMDSVVRWMPAHCAHPIRLDMPAKMSDRAHRVFVHQPGE